MLPVDRHRAAVLGQYDFPPERKRGVRPQLGNRDRLNLPVEGVVWW